MLLGVPTRVINRTTEWEPGTSASMRACHLQAPGAMLKGVARKIADAIWGTPKASAVDKIQNNER